MFNNVRKGLKGWVRFDGNNNAVAGSLIFQKDKPKVGKWKEFQDVNLCCPVTDCTTNYGLWTEVTGGAAGDGTVLIDSTNTDFTFIGPNDTQQNGWVYLTRQFGVDTCLEIDYDYATFDGDATYDFPVYWNSLTQPTGIPGDLTPRVTTAPESGTWTIQVLAGEWFSIGLYSTDSCCGRGFLSIEINETEGICPTTTTTTTII